MSSIEPSREKTQILKVDPSLISFQAGVDLPEIPFNSETYRNLLMAADVLKNTDKPVAFPTETVYGLGGNALSTASILSIYKAKNRPADNPLIIHVASPSQISRLLKTAVPEIYEPLISKFWPGPLSILLPCDSKTTSISSACTVGQDTFAVRIPSHPVARALIAISDLPLAAPSANASTKPSPTLASHVLDDLDSKIPLILDGGPCSVGVESTVINGLVDPPIILRPGGISVEEIRLVGGKRWENVIVGKRDAKDDEIVRTPGMKYRHYSPKARVILFENCSEEELVNLIRNQKLKYPDSPIAMLTGKAFSSFNYKEHGISIQRHLGNDSEVVSRNLFAMLREVDSLLSGHSDGIILVEGLNENVESGLNMAVMNRLLKAAGQVVVGTKAI
ncbi:protein required for respiratory growth [Nadsonia fulvescens var. elongata DSM 6958]|uniref:Threonylcarbamoyl-AMP synthase n=1 Tax=Nadsonia fulvescens var. elongata DSM 6958 TaxID=857566 RepID=A0A1E3PMH0_9ASCO|nr:protein required for respiratory growth [Nadsonia fulvescens var. elongata DSM 6958]